MMVFGSIPSAKNKTRKLLVRLTKGHLRKE